MERNEEILSDEEIARAAEIRRANQAREDEGYTASDSLVRDDSVVTGRDTDLADRIDRAADRAGDDVEGVAHRTADSVAAGNVVHHDDAPSVGDQVGEAAGGISGVLAGAAIGSIGGPIGTVIGGIAGAIGGWWTGRAISEAASNFSHADDDHYRTDYEARDERVADRSYEHVRPAYQLGHIASQNPDYTGRSFDEIEPDLQRGWSSDSANQGGDWNDMRDYARTAYVRGAASQSSLTGDSSNKNSLSSTGTTGSIGTSDDSSAPSASSRAADYDNQSTRQRELRADEGGQRAGYADPVAGEGVENIGSSGLSSSGSEGTLNDSARTEENRDRGNEQNHQY